MSNETKKASQLPPPAKIKAGVVVTSFQFGELVREIVKPVKKETPPVPAQDRGESRVVR